MNFEKNYKKLSALLIKILFDEGIYRDILWKFYIDFYGFDKFAQHPRFWRSMQWGDDDIVHHLLNFFNNSFKGNSSDATKMLLEIVEEALDKIKNQNQKNRLINLSMELKNIRRINAVGQGDPEIIQEKKKVCVACKGNISVYIFECPKCSVLYHLRCALKMNEANKLCIQCDEKFPAADFNSIEQDPRVISIEDIFIELDNLLQPEEIIHKDNTEKILLLKKNLKNEITDKFSLDFFESVKYQINKFFKDITGVNIENLKEIKEAQNEMKNEIMDKLYIISENLNSVGLSVDKSNIMLKLDMFIERPNDLAKYLRQIIKSNWPDEKKDRWGSIIQEILEEWKQLKDKRWKKIINTFGKVMFEKFIGDELTKYLTKGVQTLFEWIRENYRQSKT